MSQIANFRPARWLSGVAVAAALVVPAALPAAASAQASPPTPAPAGAPAATPAPKKGFDLNAGMGALDKTLAKADATPDQKAKIKSIIFDAIMSLAGEAPALKATATTFGTSLMAPHVDRAGLESARVAAVADFDAFSKVMVKAVGDAAEVLTPEQRAKLAAAAKPKG